MPCAQAACTSRLPSGSSGDLFRISTRNSLLFGDPDEGLPIRKTIRERLLRQKEAVAKGERGEPFEEVIRRLGLE